MSKITLGRYLNKIEAKFEQLHEQYEKVQKNYWDKFTKYSQTDRFKYSPQGLRELDETFKADKEKYEADVQNIQKEFAEASEKIMSDSDKVFDRLYEFTPQDIDAAGIELVKSSGMSYRELMKLGQKYRDQGNMTMYYYCASHIDEDEKIKHTPLEMRSDVEKLVMQFKTHAEKERATREDHDIMEGFIYLCNAALGDRKTLADAVYKEHEGEYERHYKLAQEISVETSTPWD